MQRVLCIERSLEQCAERLMIRGIFGDSFIRVGVPERDAPEVKMLEEYINAQA